MLGDSHSAESSVLSSAIHGFVALQNLPSLFLHMGHGSTCCPECHRKAKMRADDGAIHPLLDGAQNGEYEDLEANAPLN